VETRLSAAWQGMFLHAREGGNGQRMFPCARRQDHQDDLRVEPIFKVLPIAQSTFHAHAAIARDPDLASNRAKRDAVLSPEIKRVWEENNEAYGIRKAWHQLQRKKFSVARCTVAKLMKRLDIQGVIRGKVKQTTVPDKSQPCPKDKVTESSEPLHPTRCALSPIHRIVCRVTGQ